MSRVGVAAAMLKAGKSQQFVAKHAHMTLAEVGMLSREVEAAKPIAEAAQAAAASARPVRKGAQKPKRPLLSTSRSPAIREAVAATPRRGAQQRKRWTAADDEKMLYLARAGFSHSEIAAKSGRSVGAIDQRIYALGATGVGPRSKLLAAMMQARHHLKAGDHITALQVIEKSIKEARP
jgi:hypothetical protein